MTFRTLKIKTMISMSRANRISVRRFSFARRPNLTNGGVSLGTTFVLSHWPLMTGLEVQAIFHAVHRRLLAV